MPTYTISNPNATGPNSAVVVNGLEELETITTGIVQGGFIFANFYNTDAAIEATVNGIPLPASSAKAYPITNKQYYDDMNYDANGATLLIMVIY